MPVADKPETEAERREAAINQLAIIGGKLMGEDDIRFEGTAFIIPAHLSLEDAAGFLQQRSADDEEETRFSRTFSYRPFDGARATGNAIREAFGFTLGKTLYSFFGKNPPQFIDVKTGPRKEDTEQVPWGAMKLPGLRGATLYLGETIDKELGKVFQVTVDSPRKHRFVIQGLFQLIEKHLERDSIYRGKAIDGSDQFLDVTTVKPEDVVYTQLVQDRLDAEIWSRIRYAEAFERLGQKGKRSVLFEGPYGTGKSLAALLTAQVAIEHGWTFLMCRPGRDNMIQTMQMARMYQPAVVFGEDVDVMAKSGSPDIEQTLDMMDGINTKGLKLIAVFTTNHADRIHKGMVRPGRLDGIIHVGAMDPEGVEKLTRRVIGHTLAEDIDWTKVAEAMDGYMPAFVREALDRAVSYSVSVNKGVLGDINTEALVLAANGLRDQLRLMEAASDTPHVDTLGTAVTGIVTKVVEESIEGVRFVSDLEDEDARYYLRLPARD